MKGKLAWHVVVVLILGLALLILSCGGTTTEPAVEEPAAAEAAPMAVPHTLEGGRDDCRLCHQRGAVKQFPLDHARRLNDTCAACHEYPAEETAD